jgi:hypothetical protein
MSPLETWRLYYCYPPLLYRITNYEGNTKIVLLCIIQRLMIGNMAATSTTTTTTTTTVYAQMQQERLQQHLEGLERRHLWEKNQPGSQYNEQKRIEQTITRLLGNDDPQWRQVVTDILRTENMHNNALLVIHSNISWSAVIQDSDFVLESVGGFGYRSIQFECSPFGIFSHVVNKNTDYGVLNVFVAQNGHIVKQANTGAPYGAVSITGNCEGEE